MRRKAIINGLIMCAITTYSALVISTYPIFRGTYKTMPLETIKVIDADTTIKNIDYSKLTPDEAIKEISTPAQVNDYFEKHLKQSFERRSESFAKTHERGYGFCLDYAIAASALLSDNDYKPNILALEGSILKPGHAVFLYKTSKGYGALGNTSMPAKYPTVDSLIKDLNRMTKENYSEYALVDIDKTYTRNKWLRGNKCTQYYLPRKQRIPVK
jgi:hypothetical protein